jgi:hypothetical protein
LAPRPRENSQQKRERLIAQSFTDGAVVCTAKRFNKRRSSPIELANTTISVRVAQREGSSFRLGRGFAEYLAGFHPLAEPERPCALRFKASAASMYSILHQGEDTP